MAAAIQAEVSASRYGILLAQGTFYTAGWQLANVSAVLPFICAQQGIYWAAGLLYPAYSIGTVIGNAISPFILERSRHLRHLVVTAATAAVAALIVCNAIAAQTEILVAGVFLVTSWAAGAANAISKVAISDVLSSKLPELRRG